MDALQLLIVDLARAPAGNAVDWDYWKEAVGPLEANHPTVAREQGAAATGAEIRAGRQLASSMLEAMARTLRARHYSIRTVQELLGHAEVSTTMIYTHVLNRPEVLPVRSPADF